MGGLIVNVWLILAVLIRIALIAVAVFLIAKAINYFKCKEEREMRRNYRAAQETIDEIERELNERKD